MWWAQGDVSYVCKMRTPLVSADDRGGAGRPCHRCGPRLRYGRDYGGRRYHARSVLAEAARLLMARRREGLRVEERSDPCDADSERYANRAALLGPNAKLAASTVEEWLNATLPAGRA